MLNKLIKYEFSGTARYYLPIFALVLLFSCFGRIANHILADSVQLAVIANLGYGLTLAALWVMTLVVTVARFYKNLLGNEGYLMFTLPVTAGRNVLGKLIPAVCWVVAAALLTALSALMIGFDGSLGQLLNGFSQLWREFYQDIGFHTVLFVLELLALVLLGLSAMILFGYLALSIGQLANEHKFLASVGAYIGLQFLLQIITVLAVSGLADWLDDITWVNAILDWLNSGAVGTGHLILLLLIAGGFLCCFALYLLTRYLLSKRLNLA